MDWRETTRTLAGALAPAGLDLVHAFPSRLVGETAGEPVREGRLGLLFGNTRALWPALRAAVRSDPTLRASEHPVDSWCVEHVERALASLGEDRALRWAHTPPPDAFPIQALAHAAGLCDLAPCGLAIHPELGPWLALRAVAIVEVEGPDEPPPPPRICADCAAPCLAPFEAARAASGPVESNWRLWLAVRDACPVGREHRYPEPQLAYHYTKDRTLLLDPPG
jgi:methylmalonic aciduria homocystinuria type C protein